MTKKPQTTLAKLAFRFVLIIGIVNLFADLTYEGARSIIGPFMGSLGASATVIGFVVGFGELLGYGLVRSPALSRTRHTNTGSSPLSVTPLTCWRFRRLRWRATGR